MPQEVWKSREKQNQNRIHHGRQRQEPPLFRPRNKAFERQYEPGRNKFGDVQTGHESGDFAVCDMLADCDKFPVRELCNYPFMPLEKGTKTEISEIWNILITAMQIKYRCYLFALFRVQILAVLV